MVGVGVYEYRVWEYGRFWEHCRKKFREGIMYGRMSCRETMKDDMGHQQ